MTTAPEHRPARTYGNWRRPTSPGLGRLGLLGTAAFFGGLVVSVIVLAFSLVAGLVLLALTGLVLAPLAWKDQWGRSGWERLGQWAQWTVHRRRRRHLYLSGPLSRTPEVHCRPPGLAARLEVSEALDAHHRPFVVLHHPHPGHVSTVIDCAPPGMELVDPDQVDQWVAGWGEWLANLGREPGIVATQVTIETVPDPGFGLRRSVESRLVADAPQLAVAALTEVVDRFPSGSASITVRVAVTWSRAVPGGRRRSVDDVVVDIGSRLPDLTANLSITGAGTARPLSTTELAAQVRSAYDPDIARLLAEGGKDVHVDWLDSGPLEQHVRDGALWHDGAVSVSWVMGQAPRAAVRSDVLVPLLKPHPEVPRKRITLLYRPYADADTPEIAQHDVDTATFRAQQRRLARARDSLAVRQAQKTADEEAEGAGLGRFGMIVTATVPGGGEDDVRRCVSVVDNLGRSARLRLRRVRSSQDTTFLAGLPLGLVIPAHLKLPGDWREQI